MSAPGFRHVGMCQVVLAALAQAAKSRCALEQFTPISRDWPALSAPSSFGQRRRRSPADASWGSPDVRARRRV